MCSIRTSNIYFVDWETTSKDFLKGIKFTTTQKDIKVHVFCNKKTPKADLPPNYEWIVIHPTLTSSAEASWTALITYVLHFYTHLSCQCTDSKCKIWQHPHVHTRYKAYVVCGDEARYEELEAILKYNKISIKTLHVGEKTLLDVFPYSCGRCKIIFKTKAEATNHDLHHHNFLCTNPRCEKSKRQNGFFSRKELEEHLKGQRHCEFCPDKTYCTEKQLEEHLKKVHKQCDCPCEEFFETSDDYMEHFYSNLPLPCLEDPACEERFPNIEHQAFHHKQVHGSTYPYYCMACYKNSYLVCCKTAEKLLDHVEEEKHKDEEFSFAQIPIGIALGNSNYSS